MFTFNDWAKTNVVVPVIRVDLEAARGAAVPSEVAPAPAANHAVVTMLSFWVYSFHVYLGLRETQCG